jgi:hypothetical protein
MTQKCAVHCCHYIVEAHLDDFPVCALHDARQTRGILELGELPCAGHSDDRPIVYRGGITLTAEHFEPQESPTDMAAFDDPRMLEVPREPSRILHPNTDLTAE